MNEWLISHNADFLFLLSQLTRSTKLMQSLLSPASVIHPSTLVGGEGKRDIRRCRGSSLFRKVSDRNFSLRTRHYINVMIMYVSDLL